MNHQNLIKHLRAAVAERDVAIADLLKPRTEFEAREMIILAEALRLYAVCEPQATALIPKLEAVWADTALREESRAQWLALLDRPEDAPASS